MKYYRIKQIGENEFIPQVAECLFDRIFGYWEGIEKGDHKETWCHNDLQKKYCLHNSLIEAKLTVEKYKKYFEYPRPKYHKA